MVDDPLKSMFQSDAFPNRLRLGKSERRNFSTFKWSANDSSTDVTETVRFWHVRSTCKETMMLKYLRLLFFWGLLSPKEIEFAFSHPRFLIDQEFNVLLSARVNTELSRSELVGRADHFLKTLKGKRSNFRENLISQWTGNIRILADLESRPISRRVKAKTWVRSASAVGSKKPFSPFFDPLLVEEVWDVEFDETDFMYRAITSGMVRSESLTLSFGVNRS